LSPAFSIDGAALETGRKGFLNRSKDASIEFVLCDPSRDVHACGLLQNAHQERPVRKAAPAGAFRTARSSLRSLATEGLELISGRDCAALDIGCADGTLLSFYPRWVERFGVDPDDSVDQIGEWAWTAKASFPSADLDRAFAGKKFDLITSAGMLEEIDEPRAFFARVKSLLTEDGVFALETLYAPMTLTHTSIDAFAGGVSAAYSLTVLERILRDCELKIFRGAINDRNGGSLRAFITHAESSDYDFDPWFERLAQLWDEENALALRARQPYQAFQSRAENIRVAFEKMMVGMDARGQTVHLFGVGTQSAALYAMAGAGAHAIEAVISVEEIESGARLCVGGPPIISENESRQVEPDFIVAPAALKRELLERWREAILTGASLIFNAASAYRQSGQLRG